MKKLLLVMVGLALLCLGVAVQADVFHMGAGLTNLETVTVGNPGNAADTRYATPGYGAVGYTYNIGKYEVTAAQYTDFLNNKAKCDGDPYGLYNADMGDTSGYSYGCQIQRSGAGTVASPYTYTVANDWANRPVNNVSFWDACRFANWLGNGQGNGDTETGAYTLNGYKGDYGRTIGRNAGAKWAVTSEDEWYKAAYYKGGLTNAGYWDYPMQSDIPTTPSNDITNPDSGNNANFDQNGFTIGYPYYRTNVGEFENSESAYGTFDQGGNVWEFNEAIVYENSDTDYRGLRGGSFGHTGSLEASSRGLSSPSYERDTIGFRVAEVPEPSSLVVLFAGLGSLLAFRRRKA